MKVELEFEADEFGAWYKTHLKEDNKEIHPTSVLIYLEAGAAWPTYLKNIPVNIAIAVEKASQEQQSERTKIPEEPQTEATSFPASLEVSKGKKK